MLSTLNDIYEFCWKHKKRRAFKDMSRTEVQQAIVIAQRENKLYQVKNDKGIIGVCIASIRYATKHIFVHEIICKENAFKSFIQELYRKYPSYTVKGNRDKKPRTYTRKNLWVAMDQKT